MAVCCYIMDKDHNLLIGKRPDFQKIFPDVWVLQGGIVNFGETLEHACFREIEGEVGFTFEHSEPKLPDTSSVIMSSPMPDNRTEPYKVDFKPFYLYESVTKRLTSSSDEKIPGYAGEEPENELDKLKPPV